MSWYLFLFFTEIEASLGNILLSSCQTHDNKINTVIERVWSTFSSEENSLILVNILMAL